MMIVPKANIKAIYTHILTEGVMVVRKDARQPKHEELPIPNLQVMSVMKSMKSRGWVAEEFNWQWYYFWLSDEGILALREYLHMPESVVPVTIAKGAASGKTGGRRQAEDVRQQVTA